jgi:putative heme-binding domain-containing protein
LTSLAENELSDVIKRFPPQSLDRANALLDRLKTHQQQMRVRLESLRDKLGEGSVRRGHQVFFGEKSKCGSCHRVGETGNRVGPDLTTIGANRSTTDLLESILFPSASIVRDYESHQVLTVDGRLLTGIIIDESADSIELQQPNGDRVALDHRDVEQVVASTVSMMPTGLGDSLDEDELIDVVTYLQSLR